MEIAKHSAGPDFRVVHCRECCRPMHCVYDISILHTCTECGGQSLVAEAYEETRRALKHK